MNPLKFLRYVGQGNRNRDYRSALNNARVQKLDVSPESGNVAIDFWLDGTPLELSLSDPARDLLDLAAIAYVVDELHSRDAQADRWSRSFDGVIPVRSPGAWKRGSDTLSSALEFLSGDKFSFEWLKTNNVPNLRPHRETLPEGFDVVCLFSGGLDSFLGALTTSPRFQ